MKINIIVGAIILAIIHFSPSLFLAIIAFIGIVFLFAVFHCRDEMIASFKAQRQKKRDEEYRKHLSERLATAQRALDSGDQMPMRILAEDFSLADAWCALAAAYMAAPEEARNEAAITHAYKRACGSKWKIEGKQSCDREYETRYFYGIGVETDFSLLIQDWGGGYLRGQGHEVDLAWIHTFGPEKLRSFESAWMWLSLGKARTSTLCSYILSQDQEKKIRKMVASKVAARVRCKIEKQAESEAYSEFVAGK
jgi:hypothetical protein